MRDALHRAWHSPRSGPVILLVAGLPVFILAGLLAAFPLVVVIEYGRALFTPGRVAFARTSAVYIWFGIIGWSTILLLAAQFARIARANRGLDVQFTIATPGGIRSAYRLAARIGRALGARGHRVSEVIREDYGAGLWLHAGDDVFWLAVSTDEGSEEAVVSLAYDPRIDLGRRLTRRADRATFAQLAADLRDVILADRALALRDEPPG